MTESSVVVDGADAAAGSGNETGSAAAERVLTPAERLQKQFEDAQFATLLNTRQALRFSIDELKRRPDTLADMEAQLAHVEGLIKASGREDPELVNIAQQAKDAQVRAERSAAAAAEDKARAADLAAKAKEQGVAVKA